MKQQIGVAIAVLAGTALLCAQRSITPLSIKATAIGKPPVTHSALTQTAMCDNEGHIYTRPFDPESRSTASRL